MGKALKQKKKKSWLPGALLILSAVVLGTLVIILVSQSRTNIQLSGGEVNSNRDLEGGFPTPAELIDADQKVYFAYTSIPDLIYTRIKGISFTEDCPVALEDLRYLQVLYWGTDEKGHKGELIVNKSIAEDLSSIFFELYRAKYPIESIRLVDDFGGNDEVSMGENNTSAFNGRKATNSDQWSKHAYGMAIDLNPLYNPYVGEDGTVLPVAASDYVDRTKNFQMKIDEEDYAYKLFTEHGFTWGGTFENVKDYQHFEKE